MHSSEACWIEEAQQYCLEYWLSKGFPAAVLAANVAEVRHSRGLKVSHRKASSSACRDEFTVVCIGVERRLCAVILQHAVAVAGPLPLKTAAAPAEPLPKGLALPSACIVACTTGTHSCTVTWAMLS